MKKQLTLLLIICALGLETHAQQLPIFTQYRDNLTQINPASVHTSYIMFDQNVNVGLIARYQWVGLEQSPKTITAKWDFVQNQGQHIAGAYLMMDQTGPTGFNGLYGRYGYQFQMGDFWHKRSLSIGITLGAVQYRIKGQELKFQDQSEWEQARSSQSKIMPDAGVGIFYNTDEYHLGLSIPQSLGLNMHYVSDMGDDLDIKRIQHLYFTGGYYFHIGDYSYLEPTVWAKWAPFAPVNVDLNLKYMIEDMFWIGAGGSTAKGIHLDVGANVYNMFGNEGNTQIGFGYSNSFNSYQIHFGPTYELFLGYSFEG